MKYLKSPISIIAIALLAAPAWAHDMSGNPDTEHSILNVHVSHFPHQSDDNHAPALGSGDNYGSILLDKGTHTPHRAGDNHAPEKGDGDMYGSVLYDLAKN